MRRRGSAASLVFQGGSVLTMAPGNPAAGAVAVRDGLVAAVGPAAEVRRLIGPGTRVVDLAGGAVLPGINDSHLHAIWLGARIDPATGELATLFGPGLPGGDPPLTPATRREAAARAVELLPTLGITSFTEPALGPGGDEAMGGVFAADGIDTYAELAAAGKLPARVGVLLLFGDPTVATGAGEVAAGLRAAPRLDAFDPRRLRVAGVKVFADGIPPQRTSWMGEPYLGGGHGSMTRVRGAGDGARRRELAAMVALAHDAGHQVGVHATGDRTIDAAVAAFVAAERSRPAGRRHYVIHGDYPSPEALALMAEQGIGLNAQPAIREPTAAFMRAAVGERRTHDQWPLRAALDAGVPLCLSSDAPVVTPDWRVTVAAAVLREHGGRVSGAAHRIAVTEALHAYTTGPAWQDHAGDWKGSIEAGKVADLCVLAADPLACDPRELPQVPVTMTVLGGEVVFSRQG